MSSQVGWKRRIRVFQFSLRALLVVLTLFAIWLGVRVKAARDQRTAVAAIRELGGTVSYDYEFNQGQWVRDAMPSGPAWLRRLIGDEYFQDVVSIDLLEDGVSDDDLRHLAGLPKLRFLKLDKNRINGSGLKHIRHLKSLETLSLNWTDVSDEGLQYVRTLTNLQYLGLLQTRVTDDGLAHLRALTKLDGLILADTKITDEGLRHVAGLTRLTTLNLAGTQVTDIGMNKLGDLRQLWMLSLSDSQIGDGSVVVLQKFCKLEEMNLVRTNITAQGFFALKEALPACRIYFDHCDLSNWRSLAGQWVKRVALIEALAAANRLKLLDLSDTDIGDAHLADLHELDRLELLDLRSTHVSHAAVESLRQAIPRCEILSDASPAVQHVSTLEN